jgi:carbon storage regulator
MLVLTRKPGEKLRVGGALVIEVAAAERGRVTFAFQTVEPLTLMPGDVLIEASGEGHVKVSRKVDDSVLIGGDPQTQVEVFVVSVKGEAVRVGIKAPRELRVYREEVWREIAEANEAASAPVELDASLLSELLKNKKKPGDGSSGNGV